MELKQTVTDRQVIIVIEFNKWLQIFTLRMDCDSILGPFLIPTVDGSDIEGVLCPQDQSRAAITFTGSHQLVTETGGGGGACYYMIVDYVVPRGEGGRPFKGQ